MFCLCVTVCFYLQTQTHRHCHRLKNSTTKVSIFQSGSNKYFPQQIDSLSFTSLWFSGLASGLFLSVAMYALFKIQHEHDITLPQRLMYYLACAFNTVSMMTSSLILVIVIIIPVAVYVERYHLMILVIFGATILGLGALINIILSLFSMDINSISTDRIITRLQSDNLLVSYLRLATLPLQDLLLSILLW